ncbi:MAG: hypothetical protein OXF93_15575 [Acidobacteria bacterium]|nr:hypothetical protein [Acidobacteriota bacterium]
MREAADFPNRIRVAIADPDNHKQLPRIGDQRHGVIRRTGQYDYEHDEVVVARQPDDHLGSL